MQKFEIAEGLVSFLVLGLLWYLAHCVWKCEAMMHAGNWAKAKGLTIHNLALARFQMARQYANITVQATDERGRERSYTLYLWSGPFLSRPIWRNWQYAELWEPLDQEDADA